MSWFRFRFSILLVVATLTNITAVHAAFLQGGTLHPTLLSVNGHSYYRYQSNDPSNLLLYMNASPSSRHVNFHGTAKSEIFVPQPPNSIATSIVNPRIVTGTGTTAAAATNTETRTITVQEFLQSGDSTSALLGTENYAVREDGYYDCIQPSIGWFGMQLMPVFVNRLDKIHGDYASEVKIQIVGARTNIVKTKQQDDETSTTPLVARLMEKCNFEGTSTLLVNENDEGWNMSFDLKLTLQISLPPRVPLPPGFRMIGSRIVSTTCTKRARQTLHNIKDAYEEWATEQVDSYIRDTEQATATLPLSNEDELTIKMADIDDIDIANEIAEMPVERRSWRKRIISKFQLPRRLRSRR